MNIEIINKIKNNPIIYNYLRDESYHYKYLYREDEYINVIEKLAKEKYKLRNIDKIERLKNNIDIIRTFMDVIE